MWSVVIGLPIWEVNINIGWGSRLMKITHAMTCDL